MITIHFLILILAYYLGVLPVPNILLERESSEEITGLSAGFFFSFKNRIIDKIFDSIGKLGKMIPIIIIFIVYLLIYDPIYRNQLILYSLSTFTFGFLGHRILFEPTRRQLKLETISKHFVNSIPELVGNLFLLISIALFANLTINFLGFADPSTIAWGRDINYARSHINEAPWAAFYPMGAYYILALALGMIALS